LSNTNESDTIPILQKKLEVNKPLIGAELFPSKYYGIAPSKCSCAQGKLPKEWQGTSHIGLTWKALSYAMRILGPD